MSTRDVPNSQTARPRPAWPTEPLPHIFVTENGLKACNEPYYDLHTGQLGGYCRVPVAHWDRWRRPAGTHKGDHQITWRTGD